MVWQVCIRYPNGQERPLRSCSSREVALKYIDAIYSHGYPMHVAYIARPVETIEQLAKNGGIKHFRLA